MTHTIARVTREENRHEITKYAYRDHQCRVSWHNLEQQSGMATALDGKFWTKNQNRNQEARADTTPATAISRSERR